jgi:phosphatidylserine/phosphatidylglycerophosphate/cardiolipin synthase-like enzyme
MKKMEVQKETIEYRMSNIECRNSINTSKFGVPCSPMDIRLFSVVLVVLLIVLLILVGCVKSPQVRLQIDESVSALIDREINCAEAPEGTCAIDSEFQKLADQAITESTPENPVHYATILNDGQDALLTRLHLIRTAKKSIELQVYIWINDEVGRLMFFEMLEAARRGVKVRVIADQMGSAEDPSLLARLATAHENLEISFYNPVFSRGKTTPLTLSTGALFSFRRVDQRMHNKVLVVDERVGIVGGRNIENKYYDYDTDYNFKDRDVLVMGPEVKQMRKIFERYWNDKVVVKAIYLVDVGKEIIRSGKGDKPTILDKPDFSMFSDIDNIANTYSIFEGRATSPPLQVGKVKYTADLPGKPPKDEMKNYRGSSGPLREVMTNAQKSITVQTPYFVLSRSAMRSIKKLRKKNPDIKINVSSNSLAATDLFIIYAITYKQKRDIIKKLKIDLYEFKPFPEDTNKFISRYNELNADYLAAVQGDSSGETDQLPTMKSGPRSGMHAKSIAVDSKIAIIGSHNLDPRSASINTESAVIIWDEEIARRLDENIRVDMEPQNSWVVTKRQEVPLLSHFAGIIDGISSMLPFVDIWPFRYSSSFELTEGMEPLPQDHPDFYKHYKDVGQFPGINLSSEAVKTRLFKAFGGFATPMM